ncbi:Uncharacterised protein [uncultured archaeon]|nr:Uncharacterised protein [uncultured archaeon]
MRERILLVFVGFMVVALFGPSSAAISDSGNTQILTSLPSTFAIDTSSSIKLGVHGGGNWQPGQSFDGNQIILVSANNKWQLTVYDSSSWKGADGHMHLVTDPSKELKFPLDIVLNDDIKLDNKGKPIQPTIELTADKPQPVATSTQIGYKMMQVVNCLQQTSSDFTEASGDYQVTMTFVVSAAV